MKRLTTVSIIGLALAFSLPMGSTQAKSPAHGKKGTPKTKPAPHAGTQVSGNDAGEWKPDPKLLSQLQPEQEFGPYMLRVPVGYSVTDMDVPATGAKVKGYLLKGPTRPDGTFPRMLLVVMVANSGYVTRSVDKLLNMDEDLNTKPGLVRSRTEDGQTPALEMSRQYFKFPSDTDPARITRGFFYATTDSHTDARMEAKDAEPDCATSLPLLEAAARTLRKP